MHSYLLSPTTAFNPMGAMMLFWTLTQYSALCLSSLLLPALYCAPVFVCQSECVRVRVDSVLRERLTAERGWKRHCTAAPPLQDAVYDMEGQMGENVCKSLRPGQRAR